MAKILTFIKVVRNNWKKSVVAVAAVTYGIDLANTEYKKNMLIRKYSKEAVKYGDLPLSVFESPRHIAVILNPAANKRKAVKEYEKYCAPLLHLAGISVSVLTTNKETDAISLTAKVPANVDAVVIAGGDGTVSEVVTGLLRLRNENSFHKVVPVGILPLGKSNSLANDLYASNTDRLNKLFRLHVIMDATYSIIREITKPLNVMEIRNIDVEDNENQDTILKPVYAVSSIQLGAFKDAHKTVDKYWYLWKLRSLAPYVLGSYHQNNVSAKLKFTPPCSGCVKCYKDRSDFSTGVKQPENKRWWHAFIPRFQKSLDNANNFVDYEKIVNPLCGVEAEKLVDTLDLSISPQIDNGMPSLRLDIGPSSMSYLDFVKEGWSRENNDSTDRKESYQTVAAQKLYFTPLDKSTGGKSFSIDNEEFELKEIAVTLLHNILSIFHEPQCNKENKLLP